MITPKVYTYFSQSEAAAFKRLAEELGVTEYELLKMPFEIYLKLYVKKSFREFIEIMSNAP